MTEMSRSAGQRHLQRPWDRRGRQRDDVDAQLELAQELLLAHAEALLLVDDDQAEVLGPHVARQQAVGADEDVDLALGEGLDGRALLALRAEARDVLDRERVLVQALGEGAVVLLRQDRRRHEHQHLLAVLGGDEGRAQRDLGLAVADVAADEPVHRARGLHVGLDRVDGVALVRGLAVGEGLLELRQPFGLHVEGVAGAALALGVELEQLARHLLGRLAGARLHALPGRAAELAQRRGRAAGADVARDLGQLVDRHEHAVGALELELQVVAGDPGHGLGVEAGEAGDAVVLVHDDVARAQVGEAAQAAGARPRPVLGAAPADEPVLGQHRELEAGRDEALAQAGQREAELAFVHRRAIEPRRRAAGQVVGGALALAAARPRDHGAVARAHELVQLGLGLAQRARGRVRRLGVEAHRLVRRGGGQAHAGALVERCADRVGALVEVVGVGIVE